MTDTPGDALLSPYYGRLWSFHQNILFRWGVYTLFTSAHYNVPEGTRGYITWLVPLDTPHRDEIVAYLNYELADLQREGAQVFDTFIPGRDVTVMVRVFSGVQPYVDRDTLEALAASATEQLHQRLKREKEAKK